MSVTIRRITKPETYVAVLVGEPGEPHERPCALCEGPLLAGDQVFVTATQRAGAEPLVHALSHYPDCTRALERAARGG